MRLLGGSRRVAAGILLIASLAPGAALSGGGSPAAPSAAASAATTDRWSRLADPVFQQLGVDDGLPTPVTTAVAEDRDGFLWVGTQNGLARWDGYRFRVFLPDPGDVGALPNYFVQCLHTDTRGRLWIGTSGGGLSRYERSSERFLNTPAGPQGVSHVSVRSIADDGSGGVWVGTDGGLDHLDGNSKLIERFRHDDADPASLPDDHVAAVLLQRLGTLWVGTQKGLARRRSGSAQFEWIALPPEAGETAVIASLFEASDGRIWIGTATAGAFVLDPADGNTQAVASAVHADAAATSDWVYTIAEAGNGEIWLGTFGQGVVTVDSSSLSGRRIRHDASVPSSLADNTVWGLLHDRAGLIWTATQRGLSRYDPGQAAVLSLLGASGRTDGITDTDVRSVLALADGRIWLGLGHNGVDILDPAGQRVAGLRPAIDHPETALPSERVLSMQAAPDATIFLGTDRGLYRADADARGVQRLRMPAPNPIPEIRALLVDEQRLWIGGPEGLWSRLLDAAPGAAAERAATSGMTDQRVMVLERGLGGLLWIGTRNGLNSFNPQTGAIEAIPPDPADGQALSTGFIMSLLTDRRGRLWVGTLGGGLCILESHDASGRPRFRRIGISQGLPDPDVAQMLTGPDGNVWVSTDNGLAVIDPNSFAVRSMQRADGVVIGSYWSNSGAVTPAGELLFGALGGLTVVRAERLRDWNYRPPVVITDLRVGGKPVAAGSFNGSTSGGALSIAADANSLAVEFSALDYSAPERNRYAYLLEGYDKDWISTDPTRRLAAYANLPPGEFRLRLRGSNRVGSWTERELLLPIRVLPSWYQTWWFRAGCAFGLAALLYLLVRWRTATLQHRQRQLEEKVRERTAELESTSRALHENSRALEENSRALERNSRKLEEKSRALEEASLTDPLTGLRNRRFLAQHLTLDTSLCIRRHEEHAGSGAALPDDSDLIFFMADIDHFKHVNDIYGHAAGDAILMQMRERLQKVFHETDYLIRWGGEEFLVVARGIGREQAALLAERVRLCVADERFSLDDERWLNKTCSVGFACFPFLPDQPRALGWLEVIEIADVALYAAKRSGRNAWVGLSAGDRVQAEGLMQRIRTEPQATLERRELRSESSLSQERVSEALRML